MDKFYNAPVYNGGNMAYIWSYYTSGAFTDFDFLVWQPNTGQTEANFESAGFAAAAAYETAHSYTVTNSQNFTSALAAVAFTGAYSSLTGLPTIPSTTRTTSVFSPSLVGTGATGTQVSATKDSQIKVNASVSTTANLTTAATSVIALKICSTNSSTEANWTTVATLENDQTLGLLGLSLSSLQVVKGQLVADVPAGWYFKLENSGTGTHTETAITGQQTIFG